MKILVVPDIHCKWQKADYIVKRFEADKVVLLGDYFDNFGDSPKLNGRTAEWLIKFLNEEGHIALLGNHELNYFQGKCICQCSGYSKAKSDRIDQIMSLADWRKLVPYYFNQGWYFTHAGISKYIGEHPINGFDPLSFNKTIERDYESMIMCNSFHSTCFRVGRYRGGRAKSGGITWCDFNHEFEPIEGLKQVFGHTPLKEPKNIGDNWCIDTHLKHVAIIENGLLRVVAVD